MKFSPRRQIRSVERRKAERPAEYAVWAGVIIFVVLGWLWALFVPRGWNDAATSVLSDLFRWVSLYVVLLLWILPPAAILALILWWSTRQKE